MRKADNKRLSKAILISIAVHVFLLFGMNLLNWFPVDNIRDKYTPLTVKIESRPVEAGPNDLQADHHEEILESSENKIPEPETRPVDQSVTKVESSSDTVYDPYADLGINNNLASSYSEPEPLEEGTRKTPHVPTGENIIELEEPDSEDEKFQSTGSSSDVTEESVISVVSDNEFQGLAQAINNNDQRSSESVQQSESSSDLFTYKDDSVKFDNPGIKRKLLTNPSPVIPDDLPSDFPPEITYTVKFRLYPDGLIQVLSITPSSLYPKIDASILKALRSWTFKGSSGSELVEGTITLIFKGK